MKTLVVYFSASGETRRLAETLAAAVGADCAEIRPVTPYTDADLDWRDEHSRSTVEMKDPASRPAMLPMEKRAADYDAVFVGFPVWWYVAPTIVNTYLESEGLAGKTVVPFATSGGSGMGQTLKKLAPSYPGAKLVEGKVFRAGTGREQLAAWAEGLDL